MAEKLDCNDLKIKIENLTNLISSYSILAVANNAYASQIDSWKKLLASLKLDYDTNGCLVKLEAKRQSDILEVADKYKELDKERIEEGSTYDRSKRIFYGAIILLSAFGIMLIVKKE